MLTDQFLTIVDATQRVELKRFGSDYTCEIDTASRHKAKEQEQQKSIAGIVKKWCVWYLPKNSLSSIRVGDEIVDQDTNNWTIFKMEILDVPGTFRCLCFRIDFEHCLDEFFDLFRESTIKNSSGMFESHWTLIQTGVRAKMSDVTIRNNISQTDSPLGHSQVCQSQSFVVRGPLNILVSDQLRLSNGEFYRISKIVFPPEKHGWIEIEAENIPV